MAAVTLATLEATNGLGPVGTASFRRWITVNGPMKTEYLFYTPAAADNFTNGDTTHSLLAHPYAAEVVPVNSDLGATAFPGSVDLDNDEASATFKTLTIHDCQAATVDGLLIKVHGY